MLESGQSALLLSNGRTRLVRRLGATGRQSALCAEYMLHAANAHLRLARLPMALSMMLAVLDVERGRQRASLSPPMRRPAARCSTAKRGSGSPDKQFSEH